VAWLHPGVSNVPSAREQLVLAAERLFARDGIAGASLRRISAEAQNTNNSAVHYYFGSRSQLVQALYEYRLTGLHAHRESLVAQRGPIDLYGWLECHVTAVMDLAEQPGSHYLGFMLALSRHTQLTDERDLLVLPADLRSGVKAFHAQLRSFMNHLPEPLRTHRWQHAQIFILQAAALREDMREAGRPRLPLAAATADIVDGMAGFLAAPARNAAGRGPRTRTPEFAAILF
jgi:AcrR family transcriptional regulator